MRAGCTDQWHGFQAIGDGSASCLRDFFILRLQGLHYLVLDLSFEDTVPKSHLTILHQAVPPSWYVSVSGSGELLQIEIHDMRKRDCSASMKEPLFDPQLHRRFLHRCLWDRPVWLASISLSIYLPAVSIRTYCFQSLLLQPRNKGRSTDASSLPLPPAATDMGRKGLTGLLNNWTGVLQSGLHVVGERRPTGRVMADR